VARLVGTPSHARPRAVVRARLAVRSDATAPSTRGSSSSANSRMPAAASPNARPCGASGGARPSGGGDFAGPRARSVGSRTPSCPRNSLCKFLIIRNLWIRARVVRVGID
jgi:hypothetical protein